MLLRCLRAELIKFRRSPVWLAFCLLPVFPAILGTMNYLGNLGLLQSEWYSLWSQHTLFSSMFFLPALLGVFCAWQWRLEHSPATMATYLFEDGFSAGPAGPLMTELRAGMDAAFE